MFGIWNDLLIKFELNPIFHATSVYVCTYALESRAIEVLNWRMPTPSLNLSVPLGFFFPSLTYYPTELLLTAFSVFSLAEYVFGLSNILFHLTIIYDLPEVQINIAFPGLRSLSSTVSSAVASTSLVQQQTPVMIPAIALSEGDLVSSVGSDTRQASSGSITYIGASVEFLVGIWEPPHSLYYNVQYSPFQLIMFHPIYDKPLPIDVA